jgi:putative intracellular protease/amidase
LIVTTPSLAIVAGGVESVRTLRASGDVVDYVRKAFRNAKPQGALSNGARRLTAAKMPGASFARQPADFAQGFVADVTATTIGIAPLRVP